VAFEDIILFYAMFRAAPLSCGLADELIQRKSGQKEFTYPHPLLEAILSESKGLYVYHEQHIYTAVILAGFTFSQANAMRKILAKKIVSKLKEIRAEFLKGAAQKGISEKSAISVFDLMENTCEFSFSKANATTLALLSFRSAYLKAHFPNEFNAATLSIKYGVGDKRHCRQYRGHLVYICKRVMGKNISLFHCIFFVVFYFLPSFYQRQKHC